MKNRNFSSHPLEPRNTPMEVTQDILGAFLAGVVVWALLGSIAFAIAPMMP